MQSAQVPIHCNFSRLCCSCFFLYITDRKRWPTGYSRQKERSLQIGENGEHQKIAILLWTILPSVTVLIYAINHFCS